MSDEVAVGSHLVSQRHFHGALPYTHHGIYIGNGQVVHYVGLGDDPDADGTKIQVVTLEGFHGGNGYWLVPHPLAPFAGEKVVERARSRLGEDGYSVCANNCEHFCNWAIDGNHASQQVDVGALASAAGGGGIGGIVGGLVIPAVAATATNLAGGAAMMKGLAVIGTFTGGAVGGLATAGGALGLAVAYAVNNTILTDEKGHSSEEADARRVGRVAAVAGAGSVALGTVVAVSAAGVPGLSAAGITSGIAAIGGGSMAAGMAVGVAAPAVAAVALGYGAYKLAQNNETVRKSWTTVGDAAGNLAAKGVETATQAAETIAPVVKEASEVVGAFAKRGLLLIHQTVVKPRHPS